MLLITIIATAISCALLTFFLLQSSIEYLPLYLAAFLKFSFGNMLPICRAGIVDFYISKGFRFIMGISTLSIAEGYLTFEGLVFIEEVMILLIISLLLILSLFAIFLKDSADDKSTNEEQFKEATLYQKIKIEVKDLIMRFFKNKKFLNTILAYILWELSFYIIFLLSIDLDYFSKHTSIAMILGYSIGVLSLSFLSKIRNPPLLKGGVLISLVSLIILCIGTAYFQRYEVFSYFKYLMLGFFAFGYGLIVPSMFSMLTNSYGDLHSQGKLYGLIESGDGVSFIVAFFLGVGFTSFHVRQLSVFIFSLIIFVLGTVVTSKVSRRNWIYGKVIDQKEK